MVTVAHLFFQFRQSFGQFLVDAEQLPQADEGPHDLYVDFDGPRTSQDTGKHGHALLGKGVGFSAEAHFGYRIGGHNL